MLRKQLVFKPNTLYHGDCLDVMNGWEAGCVDLIYLDPPFNSDANYNILYGKDRAGKPRDEPAQFTAFKDTWFWSADAGRRVEEISRATAHPAHRAIKGLAEMLPETGMLAYLVYMAERIAAMHRVLKDTGSIYLHCDPTASHYLKTVLDCVFGARNFRNEIVWKKTNSPKAQSQVFGNQHEIIFFYNKTSDFVFHKITKEPDKQYLKSYRYQDDVGRYQTIALSNNTSMGGFGKMKVWEWRGVSARWIYSKQNLEKWWNENKIVKTKTGYRKKFYLHQSSGPPISDIWVDKDVAPIQAKEQLGYPTQKPLALVERIIKASSNEGDIVLDPFCGCGTTAEAAYKLGRKLIGIDISPYTITRVCTDRLKHAEGIAIQGLPTDMDSTREMAEADRFLFEQWAVTTLPGFEPNDKQTGDGGIDGRGFLLNPPTDEKGRCVVQVKSGGFTPDNLRALLSKITGGYASMGIFVTMDKIGDTKTVHDCVANAGQFTEGAKTFDRMMFWSMEEHFARVQIQLPAMAHPRTGKALQEMIPAD